MKPYGKFSQYCGIEMEKYRVHGPVANHTSACGPWDQAGVADVNWPDRFDVSNVDELLFMRQCNIYSV